MMRMEMRIEIHILFCGNETHSTNYGALDLSFPFVLGLDSIGKESVELSKTYGDFGR